MLICEPKGCDFFGALITMNTDGTCDFTQPGYLKKTSTVSVSISSDTADDDGVVDNENGCTNATSSCSGELTWEGRICNTAGMGQNKIICDSQILLAIYKHDGANYGDDWANVPAETLLAFGGLATISSIDYNLTPSRNDFSTVSFTATFDAGKFDYGPLRDETNTLTFDNVCALAA